MQDYKKGKRSVTSQIAQGKTCWKSVMLDHVARNQFEFFYVGGFHEFFLVIVDVFDINKRSEYSVRHSMLN
jgi:hypothetical protein